MGSFRIGELVQYTLASEPLGIIIDYRDEWKVVKILWFTCERPMWVERNYIKKLDKRQ
jgi:hypothetical protein